MNKINRHNYEEFLLLYVDNELTRQERAEVELFVQQNSDLKHEFETLQQTRLSSGEKVTFQHKGDLLNIKSSIAIDNWEEFYLSYIDNELDENTKQAVEKFVLQHPQLQDKLTLLKQTVLPKEKIVFQNKKSLYKREERRIIPFTWMRFAAAASVLGVAALLWGILREDNSNRPVIIAETNKKELTSSINDSNEYRNTNKYTDPEKVKPTKLPDEAPASTELKKIKNDRYVTVKVLYNNDSKKGSKNTTADNDINIAINKKDFELRDAVPKEIKPTQQEASIVYNPEHINVPEKNNTENINVSAINSGKINEEKEGSTQQNFIKPAVYQEINVNEDNTDETLYVGNLELNKNKVRGILKKVGGLFSGRSKNTLANDDGKLQIANIEINTN